MNDTCVFECLTLSFY